MENEAIGEYEAGALMGVHFSRPKKMAREGILSAHVLRAHAGCRICFFERRQCEDNWHQYLIERPIGRPRSHQADRDELLRLLADPARPRIGVDDAICTYQAAEIIDCFPTLVPRLARKGKIVGRQLLSRRGDVNRAWIYSRRSCCLYAEVLAAKRRRRLRAAAAVVPFESWWECYVVRIKEMMRQERKEADGDRLDQSNEREPYAEAERRQRDIWLDPSNEPNQKGESFWYSPVSL